MTIRVKGDDARLVDAAGDPAGPPEQRHTLSPRRFEVMRSARTRHAVRHYAAEHRRRLRQAEEDAAS
jgi:hypothetical protein